MEAKAENNQTIFDLALQYAGSIEAAFDICRINDLSVNTILSAADALAVPSVLNLQIYQFFRLNDAPATKYQQTNVSFSSGFSQGFN